jgi:cytidylate kinase
MPVVTISRGAFSGGEALAECVAARLGCPCIDRDTFVKREAAASGLSEDDLREALVKSPGVLGRLRRKKRLYLTLLQAALAEEVAGGEAVYHGNAGHLLLPAALPVLRVRIIAPLEFRLNLVRGRMGLGPEEGAQYLARLDDERRNWTRFLYDVEWGDPSLYDLVVNLDHASIDEACTVVADMARLECFAFTPERRAALRDFALAARVRAALGLDPGTAPLEVEVWCRAGTVCIQGFVGSQRGIREIERVARGVPGIRDLDLEDLTVYHDV